MRNRVTFAYVLGWDGLREWRMWEVPLWMQVLLPVLTMGFKLGYLAGVFGEDRVVEDAGKGKKGL